MPRKNSEEQPWPDEENVQPTVSGFQEGVHYPAMPRTPEQFAQLLENPDKPAENQSAPSPEKLNPHLFGPQGRVPS
jgi:hypothetical protein